MPHTPPPIPASFVKQIYDLWRDLYIPILGAGKSFEEDAANDYLLICTIRAVTGSWLMPPGTPNLGPQGRLHLFIKHFWTFHHILKRGAEELEELQKLVEAQERKLLPHFAALVPLIREARTAICEHFKDIRRTVDLGGHEFGNGKADH